MQRIISFLLLLFLPLAALADGMVVPTIAYTYTAKITIPDQCALIHFTNGTERLVIETRFTGSGTNFAWVVPLPSRPVIEEATTGLFPTLQYLFRPEIVPDVPRYYVGILNTLEIICLVLLVILLLVRLVVRFVKSVRNAFVIGFVLGVLAMILAALLLPALSAAKRKGMDAVEGLVMSAGANSISVSSQQAVSLLDRKIVGIFETTTIASHDAKALQTWLSQNGYTVPTNAEPVIASYVKDGWVFVATKIRRDKPDNETSTPHPLSFTFKTDKPVYPMRLTGLNSQSLSVKLYVFGPARAKIAHFKVKCCMRPNYPEPPHNDFWSWNWRYSSPEIPDIVHPLLRKWVIGSPVATELAGTLSPAEMRDDVWLNWTSFSEKKNHLFSQSGALTIALNWSTGIWAGSLLAACIFGFSNEKRRSKLSKSVGVVTVCCIGLTGLIYLSLPKTEVRLVKVSFDEEIDKLYRLYECLIDSNPVTRAEISAKAEHYLSNPTKAARWENWDNPLIGGRIREEDSPGNFMLRENGNHLEFVAYDAQGAEHVLQDRWSRWDLRTQR